MNDLSEVMSSGGLDASWLPPPPPLPVQPMHWLACITSSHRTDSRNLSPCYLAAGPKRCVEQTGERLGKLLIRQIELMTHKKSLTFTALVPCPPSCL